MKDFLPLLEILEMQTKVTTIISYQPYWLFKKKVSLNTQGKDYGKTSYLPQEQKIQ